MAAALRAFPGPVLLILSGDDLTAKEFLEYAALDAGWRGLLQRRRHRAARPCPAPITRFRRPEAAGEVESRTLSWLACFGGDGTAMKKVLMVAYHFPPLAGSSGIQRTLRFAQQLPEFGWEPIVLTADPRAYERTSDDLLDEVPARLTVKRAFALDTARQLSIGGRYLGMARAARPMDDVALRRRRRRSFAHPTSTRRRSLWSTYPIATAHVIGHALWRRTPTALDRRLPRPDGAGGLSVRSRDVEELQDDRDAMPCADARYSTFTTPGAAREYRRRYPAAADRIRVLENGFDEESFTGLSHEAAREPLVPGAVTLLHSGIVYPSERDPTQFFMAIAQMAEAGHMRAGELIVRFRAAGHDDLLRSLWRSGTASTAFVELMPPLPYRGALQEMVRADALLVLQASNCNEQIPAKLYEYLRAGRPIVASDRPRRRHRRRRARRRLDGIARLDSVADIVALLRRFLASVRAGEAPLPTADYVAAASRRGRTRELAALLDAAMPVS